ncbi:3',5'-cyclic-AMP phosphodiesterase [Lonepinella sp. MS14437]|uniref:3',5'-cyclic-AMP phosphodiesterase n=1 Tax=unclassified Lonepinella TaxID=2642006 RepID=UPI0036DE1D6B
MAECIDQDDEKIRFIQITDPHLFKQKTSELLGINTYASFQQVLNEIQLSVAEYQFVLATGDLVQDASEEGYLNFCQAINRLEKPVYWIPGNHDFQPVMEKVFSQQQHYIQTDKHLLVGNKWQILLLDSQVYGVPHGELSQYQLDWLDDKLQEYQERYSLIVLHHHLLSTNSAWLDQHNLRNAHQLLQILLKYENVRGIIHGHIHQQVDAQWNGYQVMCTPATSVQFKPDNNVFTLDTLQPAWREITLLSDGSIETRVQRIQQAEFLPNMHELGY